MYVSAVPGRRVKREPSVPVEGLTRAIVGSTSKVHVVPQILFVCARISTAFNFFEKEVEVRGFNVVFIDLSGIALLDWCDDELFKRVLDRISGGDFVAVVLSPLYSTFCQKFRGCFGTDVYGVKGLRPSDKEIVRTETLIVFRCFEVLRVIHSMCMPWVFVLPAIPRYVLELPKLHGVLQSPGVFDRSLDVGDVLVGNINGECSSLVDLVEIGIRDSTAVSAGLPVSMPQPLESTCVDT